MKLCVSTLGCPDWTFEDILERTSQLGYDGLELRGVQREFDFANIPVFDRETLPTTRDQIAAAGLKVIVVGSSTKLSSPDPEERESNLVEARNCVKLAAKLKAPFVRLFGGSISADMDKADAIKLVGDGLRAVAEYADDRGVTPLLETHDSWVLSRDVAAVVRRAEHRNLGVIWDVRHPFHAGEAIGDTFEQLRPWIRHVHLKDEDEAGYCLMGQGRVPNFDAVKLMAESGYIGHFSLEWEKAWKPEIAEPEIAFPQFVEQMRIYEQLLG